MYIRMSQYCDKVVVLKSVSASVEAFDAEGKPLRGVRKSTTVQVASFTLGEPIQHPEIPKEKAEEFEYWRTRQLRLIEKAYIEHAASGKLGGYPLLKTRSDMGDPLAKVGEFSGIISTLIEVQPGMIKNVMNGKQTAPKPQIEGEGSGTLADRASSEAISARITEICEDLLRYMSLTNQKGTDLYSIQQALDMRAAWTALGCALDSRGIGYKKITGDIDGRNAALEGADIFNEMKKSVLG